jgi:hypothetical protein
VVIVVDTYDTNGGSYRLNIQRAATSDAGAPPDAPPPTPTVLASGESSPTGIAVDATTVYFATGVAIRSVPIAGGAVTTLAPGRTPYGLAMDATMLYFASVNGFSPSASVDRAPSEAARRRSS